MQTRRRRNSDVIITNIRYPATAALVLACVAMNASALAFHSVSQPSSTSTLFRTLRSSDGQCSIGHAAQSRYSRIDTRDGAHGSSTACRMSTPISSTMSHADLAVRLDTPILNPTRPVASNYMLKSIMAVLVSDVFKTACVAFIIAFLVTFIGKSSKQISRNLLRPIANSISHTFKIIQGTFSRMIDTMAQSKETEGIPLEFDGKDGWGVCTLESKMDLGRSSYVQYDFKLPDPDNTLPLTLGQKLMLCCLDSSDNVSKKSYYVFSPKKSRGFFSIVAPKNPPKPEEREAAKRRAKGEGDFSQVLSKELEVGDEIALQPGQNTLDYKGEYLPVTDMVYFAAGDGIVPVIDQVKSVLPAGSSSVKGVSVVWTNKEEKDFDVAIATLEDEYFKYSTKLAVSCIVDEEEGGTFDENEEVAEAVPDFNPGTMAVISGDKTFMKSAYLVLQGKGYPDNCLCFLPDE